MDGKTVPILECKDTTSYEGPKTYLFVIGIGSERFGLIACGSKGEEVHNGLLQSDPKPLNLII